MPSAQELLRDAWLCGPDDRLCGREQAKAWALREYWREHHDSEHGLFAFVASKVRKNKRGKPSGANPTGEAMKEFFRKIDEDEEWFPGKHCGAKRGPDRVITGGKKTGLIAAAKRIKREGGEVTYPKLLSRAPQAALNPATGEPVHKNCVYAVLREHVPDPSRPDDHWDNRPRYSREALSDKQIKKRYAWALWMRDVVRHTVAWYYMNLVWCDLCCSILPRCEPKATEQALARKSHRFWGSKAEQAHSQNLRGSKKALKMKSSGTVRIWFVPVLTRGKFHIEALPEDFPGETEEGAAIMVARVRAALNVRFRDNAPAVLMTDRGNGFFESNSGKITDGYRDALREHGLKCFQGQDAHQQPGMLQELMLHETIMAWVRVRLSRTVPPNPCGESYSDYVSRLKRVAAYINEHHKVGDVCHRLPARVQKLIDAKGDRIAE